MLKIIKNIFCISLIVLFISCIREQEKSSITTDSTTLKSSKDVINSKEKDAVFQENLNYLRSMGYDEDNDSYIDVSAVNKAATLFKAMNMRMTRYPALEKIKKELSTIQESYSMDNNDILRSVFIQRIKFHLSNPITYYEWKPTQVCNPLRVLVSPDNKYKFYTTKDLCEGSASERVTYYQFLDSIGHLVCKEWQGNVMDLWQFNHNDTTFYVSSYNTTTGCESEKIPLHVNIYPVPGVPTVTPDTICGAGTVTLTALYGENATLCRWFANNVTSDILATGQTYTPSVNSTKTYYVESYNETSGCTSSRVPVTAIVNKLPNNPLTTDFTNCGPITTDLAYQVTGGTLYRWYDSDLQLLRKCPLQYNPQCFHLFLGKQLQFHKRLRKCQEAFERHHQPELRRTILFRHNMPIRSLSKI